MALWPSHPGGRELVRGGGSHKFTFGIHPTAAFPQTAARRLHVCNDEVAVNQKLSPMPLANGEGFELTGLASRCMRENNQWACRL
jgi:hypothetical protein